MSIGWRIFEKMSRPAHDMKASQFTELVPPAGSVVFLGDSITEGGLWHEWFAGVPVANRGIDGDTTQGVLERLTTAVAGAPAKLFLLIGTNDLSRGDKPADIAARVSSILDRISAESPNTKVYLQSVMPRNARYRARLTELHALYKQIARNRGVEFVDLWPTLADDQQTLRQEYTLDNLHLGGRGYRAWVDVLRDHLS